MDLEKFDRLVALREIPPVNELLANPAVIALINRFGRTTVIESIKLVTEEYRNYITGAAQKGDPNNSGTREQASEYIVTKLEEAVKKFKVTTLKRVINATGIVLHTNLGRAPLPRKAIEAIDHVCNGYCSLEFDIGSGERGSRHSHIEGLITHVTGAESAIIVNNNAAAVFLCLNTLANNKEVIISRGQQVEIGGSFRIPDIIGRSGAKMVEVGTTNKTRAEDYSNAINGETAVLLRVHTSNYKITGFTQEASITDLIDLSRKNGLIMMEDLGSGCLYDFSQTGLPYEPTVQDSIKIGADIVTFSGDKLLGGPQAGIIAGKKDLIDKIKKNPLARMVRCDKTSIAAMAAVLSLYMDIDEACLKIPVLKMLAMKEAALHADALELLMMIKTALGDGYMARIVDESDEVGGGAFPGVVLNGKAVALTIGRPGANEAQTRLREAEIPVICRINRDRILFNVRTIDKKDYPYLVETLTGILE